MASSLQSKLGRAIRALLIQQGAGSLADTVCELSSADRALPITTILTGDGAEHIPHTGNWRFGEVTLELHDSAVIEPDEVSQNRSWLDATERYSNVRDALGRIADSGNTLFMADAITAAGRALATSDGSAEGDQQALDNADMAAFTVTWWHEIGLAAPTASDTGGFWEAQLKYDCICCNSSLS